MYQLSPKAENFSIHALLAESDRFRAIQHPKINFSIHALLAESDPGENLINGIGLIFSIHALLAESDETVTTKISRSNLFYPRSPCGERRVTSSTVIVILRFSIHALLAESDPPLTSRTETVTTFLSTLSLRRATDSLAHAPPQEHLFYPRSPCGERQKKLVKADTSEHLFSIHALLAESDKWTATWNLSNHLFYPRSPCGERPVNVSASGSTKPFSIHALLAESDGTTEGHFRDIEFSIHALLAESDEQMTFVGIATTVFLSTLSLRRATWCCTWSGTDPTAFLSTLSLRRATSRDMHR